MMIRISSFAAIMAITLNTVPVMAQDTPPPGAIVMPETDVLTPAEGQALLDDGWTQPTPGFLTKDLNGNGEIDLPEELRVVPAWSQ